MPLEQIVNAGVALREAAAKSAWRQWGAIFSFVPSGDRPARAIVDPEALVLASMAFAEHEPRLWRVCKAWARTGVRLLSVQRTKNLCRTLFGVETLLQEFAAIAFAEAGDRRWRSLSDKELPGSQSQKERAVTPLLGSPAALMLRMRLAMGVGIKADVISFLVGMADGGETVQQITSATRYHGRAVRRAVEELAAAGFIEMRATAPASYGVKLEAWAEVLDINPDDPPAWRPWAGSYAFANVVSNWIEQPLSESASVAASLARDFSITHREALDAAGVRQTRPEQYPGEAFLEPFEKGLVEYAEYLDSVA